MTQDPRPRLVVWLAPALLPLAGGCAPIFKGDVGNIFWTLATFLAVVFVLGKFAWGPILSALQKRETFIRDSLQQAKEDREKAEAAMKEHEARLAQAREEASAIVEEGRRDAEVLRRKLQTDAQAEANATLERAKREIDVARDTAVKDLYALTAQLSTEVAARVLRAELDSGAHERLISESIEELAKIRGDSGTA
jgi:F-type H+-transporting ATPase subunit b